MIGVSVHKHTLSNGITILAIPNNQAPVVSLQGWIRFGSADETEDIAGVAHLFEHLLFKGTEKRAVGQIAVEVEGLGGDLNAYTTYDHTVMHMTLPAAALGQGLEILADSLLNSTVDPDELERERPVILEEIKRRNDMPGAKASDLLRAELFQEHPYARPVIGYASVVEAIPREKILEQYKKYYNSKNLFLVIAGDFNEDAVLKICERQLSCLAPGYVPGAREQARQLLKPRQAFAHNPTPDAILNIGWQAPRGSDPQVAALDALALIVGQGESSRLVRKLVHEQKLLREIGAGCWSPKDPGSFVIGMKGPAGTSKKFPAIVKAIGEALEMPITTEELEKAKKNLLSSATYSKETVDGLAQRFGYFESIAGEWEYDSHYMEQISQLTVSDLEKCKTEFLDWNRAVGAGIVPQKDPLPEFTPPTPRRARRTVAAPSKNGNVDFFTYNGLKVIVKTMSHLPIFSMRWIGLGGSRVEPLEKSGVGSLWARSVANGGISPDGEVWGRTDLNKFIDESSASLNAFHGRNSWGYQLDGLSADFESLLNVLIAVRDQPLFDKNIVAQERSHLLLDIQSASDSPGTVVSQLFMENMFGKKHSYGRPSGGRAEVVRKLTVKDLHAYHKRLLKEPQVLCVVGDITADRVQRVLEWLEPDLKVATKSVLEKPKRFVFGKESVKVRKKLKKEQTHILLGSPTCTLFDKDRWPLLGLSSVLSGQGGRLFLELRDKMSLCYTVSPTHMEGIDGGYFGFYIATSPEKEGTAIEALKGEIDRLLEGGVPETEWEKARNFYIGNYQIDQQRFANQATGMALDELYGFGFDDYFAFEKHLRAVQAGDLSKIARKYFDGKTPNPAVTAVVGPK